MKVKFNPTGTHVHKGFLKVRIDLYPDVGEKTYEIHHIQVPVIPPEGYRGKVDEVGRPIDQNDYDNWIDSLPKVWQLNPALCHFIKIKEGSTKADLTDYLEQVFTPTLIKTLDDSLILPNSLHLISPLMRNKATLTTEKIATKDIEGLVETANSHFASLVLKRASGDKGLSIEPQTIDIGPGAAGRTGTWNFTTYTTIDSGNPANATGTIDTWEIWCPSNATAVKIGTFYGSDTSYTSRDYETVGDVTGGSKQTFSGLDNDVETGDFVGAKATQGSLEGESDSTTTYYDAGDQFGTGVQTYIAYANYVISLYGTGAEVGGDAYFQGLSVQPEGELALCDVGTNPLRIRKGGVTYGIELVDTGDPNASRIRIQTGTGIKAIRKYT